MLSPDEAAKIWPDQPRWQRIVLLAQELASTVKPCGGCDNSHLEIPARDCCVYDRAAAILDKMEKIR